MPCFVPTPDAERVRERTLDLAPDEIPGSMISRFIASTDWNQKTSSGGKGASVGGISADSFARVETARMSRRLGSGTMRRDFHNGVHINGEDVFHSEQEISSHIRMKPEKRARCLLCRHVKIMRLEYNYREPVH